MIADGGEALRSKEAFDNIILTNGLVKNKAAVVFVASLPAN